MHAMNIVDELRGHEPPTRVCAAASCRPDQRAERNP